MYGANLFLLAHAISICSSLVPFVDTPMFPSEHGNSRDDQATTPVKSPAIRIQKITTSYIGDTTQQSKQRCIGAAQSYFTDYLVCRKHYEHVGASLQQSQKNDSEHAG